MRTDNGEDDQDPDVVCGVHCVDRAGADRNTSLPTFSNSVGVPERESTQQEDRLRHRNLRLMSSGRIENRVFKFVR